jgi:hypothetical protein
MASSRVLIQGQDSWARMTSLGGKLTTLSYHPIQKVNKAEELTYLSANIELYIAEFVLMAGFHPSILPCNFLL